MYAFRPDENAKDSELACESRFSRPGKWQECDKENG